MNVIYILLIFLAIQFPLGTAQMILLIVNKIRHPQLPEIHPERKILVVFTTIGGSVNLVNRSIANIREAFRQVSCEHKIVVLTEDFDDGQYDADEVIKVPENYRTPNNSIAKHRAQHYYSQLLPDDKNTYVLHMDDDTTVNADYILSILHMKEAGGQGVWRIWKHHNLLSYADYGLSTNWDAWAKWANKRHNPIGIGGEGMVIRADVEKILGWDFGNDLYAEDYLMGQRVAKAYSWGYIDGGIYRTPPLTLRDYYKQRYRWVDHFLRSLRLEFQISPFSTMFLAITYLFGWMVLAGTAIWIYLYVSGIFVPLTIRLLFTIGIVYVFIFQQWGVSQSRSMRRRFIMLILTIPLQLMEAGVFYYMLIHHRPKDFVMIRKE